LIINESETTIAHPFYIFTSDSDTAYLDETFDSVPLHYDQPGFHLITLTLHSMDTTEDCESIFKDTIFIEDPIICEAQFFVRVNGFTVLVTNQSATSIEYPNYTISSNGTTYYRNELFDTVSFHYTQPGSYVITLLLYNSDSAGVECTDTYKDTIVIFEPSICTAKIIDKYPTFLNDSEGSSPATTYYWNFGDGATSTLKDPVHAYAVADTYIIFFVISDSTTGYI
jgi:hypothetical protein